MKKIFVICAIFALLLFVVSCDESRYDLSTCDLHESDTISDSCSGQQYEFICVGSESYYCDHFARWVPDIRCKDCCLSSLGQCRENFSKEETDTNDTGNSDNLPECSPTSTTPCKDSSTSYIWSEKAEKHMTWQTAKEYCRGLNTDKYGGFSSGWHLPNINELRTLIQNCATTVNGGSCAVVDKGNLSAGCLSSHCWSEKACEGCYDSSVEYSKFGETSVFWSSSTVSNHLERAWVVDFKYGAIDDGACKATHQVVRCVR
ncbi:DUF1566 domain-containing protein [bacterium]|nr:DUF1566 domain-containing protein [bacterium]